MWYQAADLPIRWRQTASEVHLQLLNIPPHVNSARQLTVTLEPYSIRVAHKTTGEVYLAGEFARGVVPEESTWTFSKATGIGIAMNSSSSGGGRSSKGGSGLVGSNSASFDAITPVVAASGSTGLDAVASPAAAAVNALAAAVAPAAADIAAVQQYGEGRLQVLLSKMNLELYER